MAAVPIAAAALQEWGGDLPGQAETRVQGAVAVGTVEMAAVAAAAAAAGSRVRPDYQRATVAWLYGTEAEWCVLGHPWPNVFRQRLTGGRGG